MNDQLYDDLLDILNFDLAEFADNPDYVEFLQFVKDRLERENGEQS